MGLVFKTKAFSAAGKIGVTSGLVGAGLGSGLGYIGGRIAGKIATPGEEEFIRQYLEQNPGASEYDALKAYRTRRGKFNKYGALAGAVLGGGYAGYKGYKGGKLLDDAVSSLRTQSAVGALAGGVVGAGAGYLGGKIVGKMVTPSEANFIRDYVHEHPGATEMDGLRAYRKERQKYKKYGALGLGALSSAAAIARSFKN